MFGAILVGKTQKQLGRAAQGTELKTFGVVDTSDAATLLVLDATGNVWSAKDKQ